MSSQTRLRIEVAADRTVELRSASQGAHHARRLTPPRLLLMVSMVLMLSGIYNVVRTGESGRRPVPPDAEVELPAAADSYVSATSPRQNYGTSPDLLLQRSREPSAYLRFRLPQPLPRPRQAILQLYLLSAGVVQVHRTTKTGWDENGVTYDNAPAAGALAATGNATSEGWTSLDVSSLLVDEDVLDLTLTSTRVSGPVRIASRETGATAPTLLLRMSPPDERRRLLFADDFSGMSLNRSVWSTCYWWAVDGCTNAGNDEVEWYLPEGVIVGDGQLRLRATKRTVTGQDGKKHPYTSGLVSTGGGPTTPPPFAFRYGYAEIRAKVPTGKGCWPAFWLMPSDRTWPPEIDVMEGRRSRGGYTVSMTVHWQKENGGRGKSQTDREAPDLLTGWHTFGLEWLPGSLRWYVDGVKQKEYDDLEHVPATPMSLQLNLAVLGGSSARDAGTTFPADFDIDYVKVWDRR